MTSLQVQHQFFSRLSCMLWGAALGCGLPYIINKYYALGYSHFSMAIISYTLMVLLAWFGYRYLGRLFYFTKVMYFDEELSWLKRIKSTLFFLVIGGLVIMSAPLTITMVKYSLVFSVMYILFFMGIGWIYGVHLLLINSESGALAKSLAIGFNCLSLQNAFAITLAYLIKTPLGHWGQFFQLATFQYVTFMLYPLVVGMFLLMLVYVFHDRQ